MVAIQTENETLRQNKVAQRAREISNCLDKVISEGRILGGQREFWKNSLERDYEGTVGMLNSLPVRESISSKLVGRKQASTRKYTDMTMAELEDLMRDNPQQYNKLFKAEFGYSPSIHN